MGVIKWAGGECGRAVWRGVRTRDTVRGEDVLGRDVFEGPFAHTPWLPLRQLACEWRGVDGVVVVWGVSKDCGREGGHGTV